MQRKFTFDRNVDEHFYMQVRDQESSLTMKWDKDTLNLPVMVSSAFEGYFCVIHRLNNETNECGLSFLVHCITCQMG